MSQNYSIVCLLVVLLIYLEFNDVSANECGMVEFIDPKIVKGTATVKGAWPFLVALFYVEQLKFFCGGTLITSKNVLTAAHCVQQKNSLKKLAPEDVSVLVGAYNLNVRIERGVQQRDVNEIYVNPDWKVFNDKYDADLAIFVLSEIVEFTKYIRPICMPDDDPPIDAKASIVGWGISERSDNMHESIPLHANTQVLNDTYCYLKQPFLALVSSTRVFCGGGADGGSPNKGDSGGGLFISTGSAWTQYGVISASLSDASGAVLLDSSSLYTNVYKFRSWIDETVAKSGHVAMTNNANDSGYKVRIDLSCNYEIVLETVYKCSSWEANVTNENSVVNLFIGSHLTGYDAHNVSQIWFWTGTLQYIPDGIGKKFKSLEKFTVSYDDRNLGLKRLRRRNFKDMHLLWLLDVRFNDVESVDEDTLRDLPNLKYFDVSHNKLKMLHKDTFDRNAKLTTVNAASNQLEFLPDDLFKNNPLLEEAYFNENKLKTISIDFTQLKFIKKINFKNNTCIDKALDEAIVTEFQSYVNFHCSPILDRIYFS